MARKVYAFDKANHRHLIDGKEVPGITTVIKPLNDYSSINPAVLQAACDWGTAVHLAVELYCSDRLDMESLDEPLIKTIRQFENWLNHTGYNKTDFICELPLGDTTLMYGGIADIILDGKAIIEIKTREANHLTDSIQTAAQEKLWIKNGGSRIWAYERRVLHLTPDRFKYPKVNGKDDWPRFRKLLDHYHNTKLIQSWKDNK